MLRLILLLSLSVTVARRIHRYVDGDRQLDSDATRPEDYLRHRRLLQDDAPTAEDHRVVSLPLVDEIPTEFFAGHLPASEDGDKKLFYWLVAPPEEVRATAPLLIWLNGGPGCSSMEGFFLENGPLRFVLDDATNNWKLRANPYSWHLAPAWVLYVDQPVGTGLSFTKKGVYCKSDEEVNQDFDFFLQQFLLTHRDKFLLDNSLEMNRSLFFSGESHAGHYIPSMMDYILRKQPQAAEQERVLIHLGGAAIGNGWFDPFRQYSATEVAYGMGIINLAQKTRLESLEKQCHESLNSGTYSAPVCFDLLNAVVQQSFGEQANKQMVIYDARKTEAKRGPKPFPEGHELIETYLGGTPHPQQGGFDASYMDVLEALHATESVEARQHYKECTDPPYYALKDQDGLGVMTEIANLLDADIPMLFYNGVFDLVCNHISTERSLLALQWQGADGYADAERSAWMLDGETVGYVQQHSNLLYLKVLNSGHMCPKDVPDVSLAMLSTFLQQQSFSSSTQRLGRETWIESSC